MTPLIFVLPVISLHVLDNPFTLYGVSPTKKFIENCVTMAYLLNSVLLQ